MTKNSTAQFSFDASGSNGSLNPDGSIHELTTSQPGGSYGLTPGNSTTPGTDSYTYDNLSRMTQDTEAGSGAASATQTCRVRRWPCGHLLP